MFNYTTYFQLSDGSKVLVTIQKETINFETANFLIFSECESASLVYKNKDVPCISVGDHYGNVKDALISRDEEYTVTVGCGFELYFIGAEFDKEKKTMEFYNDPERMWGIKKVYQSLDEDPKFFRFLCCNDEYDLAEYRFDVGTMNIELIQVIERMPE